MENDFLLSGSHDFFGKEADMAGKKITYTGLVKMAKKYGVDKNEMFVAAAGQYITQQEVIAEMKKKLKEDGEFVTTKEYVKNRENVCVHPLVRELPKHADSANKTLAMMLEIIKALGKEPEPEGKLAEMIRDG